MVNPLTVSGGSNVVVKWCCSVCCFEWETSCSLRTRPRNPTGCPACAKKFSRIESALRDFLVGFGCESRETVLPYRWGERGYKMRCDVVFRESKVVVEYDGEYWHKGRGELDLEKTLVLLERG